MSMLGNALLGGRRPGLFASRSVIAHLTRGALAAACLAWAVGNQEAHPVLALTAIAGAVVAMRGCPMCWTIGLCETVAARLRR